MRISLLVTMMALSGCATVATPPALSTLVDKPDTALVAFAIEDSADSKEIDSIVLASSRKPYQIPLGSTANMGVAGAKVYVVPLPPGLRYAMRGIGDGSMVFETTSDSFKTMKRPMQPGKIVYIGSFGIKRPHFRRLTVTSPKDQWLDQRVYEEVKKTFPRHEMVDDLL